ncbi:uncharacterized protein BYT42DRAFT_228326 [Radiomyces spectabilis]|uniref:uncharacterized protein n=1 Tax=Radiomyces spectabilis TaxID=64574 RepID=UPI00221ECEE4|nr:uncharacterized protein BYT42DRAFT_228326 [Radiomyces spectabilis]KAI8388252.1 hypothetical protein BYT42DRAFT_228326 [Radiomyces spectabilis]
MEEEHHTKLLPVAWMTIAGNSTYYVKSQFETNQYRLLATDLKQVWFEYGSVQRIRERAVQQRLEIDSEHRIEFLLKFLRKAFEKSDQCRFRIHDKELEIHCNQQTGFTAMSWIFICELVPSIAPSQKKVGGAAILYDHFIMPMITVMRSIPNTSLSTLYESDILEHASRKMTTETGNTQESSEQHLWLDCLNKANQSLASHDQATDTSEIERSRLPSASESPEPRKKPKVSESSPPVQDIEDEELRRRRMLEETLEKKRSQGKKRKRLF